MDQVKQPIVTLDPASLALALDRLQVPPSTKSRIAQLAPNALAGEHTATDLAALVHNIAEQSVADTPCCYLPKTVHRISFEIASCICGDSECGEVVRGLLSNRYFN